MRWRKSLLTWDMGWSSRLEKCWSTEMRASDEGIRRFAIAETICNYLSIQCGSCLRNKGRWSVYPSLSWLYAFGGVEIVTRGGDTID